MNQLVSCPNCKRELRSTLSICPSCGTMIHDSVREELNLKVVPIPKKPKEEPLFVKPLAKAQKESTSEINPKSTDPTLLEFSNQKTPIPEWRLRLKAIVREKTAQNKQQPATQKTEKPAPKPAQVKNEVILNALRRIEQSRREAQLESESTTKIEGTTRTESKKKIEKGYLPKEPLTTEMPSSSKKPEIRTFTIGTRSEEASAEKFKTNKLPDISEVLNKIETRSEALEEELAIESTEVVEAEEDFVETAPLSQRLTAGFFDLLIGAFLSFVLLLPFVLTSKNLFSSEWAIAFLTTNAIVLFIYFTTCTAFFGKTIGMRIFSLEVIDVESNEYPTLHQASINTIVYLLSLLTCGLGFLPAIFNEDSRTMHDLVSGTIVVKEP